MTSTEIKKEIHKVIDQVPENLFADILIIPLSEVSRLRINLKFLSLKYNNYRN